MKLKRCLALFLTVAIVLGNVTNVKATGNENVTEESFQEDEFETTDPIPENEGDLISDNAEKPLELENNFEEERRSDPIEETNDLSLLTGTSEIVGTGKCGEQATWSLDGDGVLTISGIGKMKDYKKLGQTGYSPWYNKIVKHVIIDEGITSIGNQAFLYNREIESISLPASLETIGDSFIFSSVLSSIILDEANDYFCLQDGILYNKDKTILVHYPSMKGDIKFTIPNTVKLINNYAFSGCNSLKELEIPGNVETVGHNSFEACENLSNISFCYGLKVIEDAAFDQCNSITNIRLNDSVSYIGSFAFRCANLKRIRLPEGLEKIENFTFQWCEKLETINIPESIKIIGYQAFGECKSLKKITIPQNVTEIGAWAFWHCDSLANITIPDSVTLIEDNAFGYCESLTSVTLSKNITYLNVGVFGNCVRLEKLILPENVTGIDRYVFENCTNLKSITIPESVSAIGAYSFDGCYNLSDVYYGGSFAKWSKINIGSYNTYLKNATLHYEEFDSDSISSITKVPGAVNHYYGVNTYKNTPAGDVYDDADLFIKAMDNYLSELKKAAQKDMQTINKTSKSPAQLLKEADEGTSDKIITMDVTMPETALNSVYETLAQYLDMYVEKGVSLGKIDTSVSTIEISTSIVNKIRNNLDSLNFTRKVGKYTVTFKVIKFMWAYTGSVTVQGNGRTYTGVIVSNSEETATALTTYYNDMSKWVEDALYQSLKSIFTELADITGISDYTKNEIKAFLKDKVDLLQKKGYGDLLTYWLAMRDGYDVCQQIVAAKDATTLSDVLNSAESIYNKIKKLDYSDEAVSNKTVITAMNKLNNAKNNLEQSLYYYIYGTDNGNSGERDNWWTDIWNTFKSIFIQCPVDFVVYDSNGNELGKVVDTEVTYKSDIYIKVDDDVKTIIIPSGIDAHIEFIGTDTGDMDYVIEQTVDGAVTGRANYYNIPLSDGGTYLQNISGEHLAENNSSELVSNGKSYAMSEYISAENGEANIAVACDPGEGGTVIGAGDYAKGSPVVLAAYPESESVRFVGWYVDDYLVEADNVYRFAAINDVTVKAVFEECRVADELYYSIISEEYGESTDISIFKSTDNLNDIIISMAGLENIESLSVLLKEYDEAYNLIGSVEMETQYDGVCRFIIPALELKGFSKIEIYDKENKLIGTIKSVNAGEEIKTVNISYNANGGKGAPKTQKKSHNKTLVLSKTKPTRTGYTFQGWSSNKTATKAQYQPSESYKANKELTLYAVWKANTYKVAFHKNGGSGSISTVSRTYNKPAALPDNAFKRSGYKFKGWNTKSDGSGVHYSDKASVKNLTASSGKTVTLYAQWVKGQKLIYNANDGKISAASKMVYKGFAYGTLSTPTKKGYTFAGWYTAKSGGSKITSSTKVTKSSSHTLYAQWKPVKYTVKYVLNGGKNHTKNPSGYYISTSTITLQNPTRTGYRFQGWYTSSNYKTKVTKIPKGSTGSRTLYAKWASNIYTIRYNKNGAASGSMADTKSCRYGTAYTLRANTFKKTGYTFAGWSTSSSGSVAYKNKASVKNLTSKNGSIKTLYAKWTPNTYKITYNMNGGKNDTGNPASYKVTTSTITLKNPTRTGYTFKGWYTSSSYKTRVTKISKGSTGNRTLYAKWTSNVYTIRYNKNGATSGSMADTKSCRYGTSYKLRANTFKKTGYTFAGWSTSASGAVTYKDKADVKNLTSTNGAVKTLYAKWTPNVYKINYYLNGGVNSSGNPSDYKIVTSTITLKNPNRTGYTFSGWYTSSSFKTEITQISKGSTGTKNLYAKWTANSYTIHYDANGGNGAAMQDTTSCKYDTLYSLIMNSYTRSGYKFVGWNTQSDGSGESYEDGGKVKNLTTSSGKIVTLYAQWETLIVEVTQIEVSINTMTVKVGDEFPLGARITPVDATDPTVTWSSSDTSVIEVDANGYVKAVGAGEADVTATANNGVSDSGRIIVESSRIPIATAEELAAVGNDVNADYELTADIDLSGYEWSPVGSKEAPFTGSLEGNNHTVTGLTITDSSRVYSGLFGYLKGTVQNMTVEGQINLTDSNNDRFRYAGGIAGYAQNAHIKNCINYVTINAENRNTSQGTYCYAGGIAGCAADSTVIEECTNYGEVYAGALEGTRTSTYAGGITGDCINSALISECTNNGGISAHAATSFTDYWTSAYAGGISGEVGCASVKNAMNNHSVSASAFPEAATAYSSSAEAGGIAGHATVAVVEGISTTEDIKAEGNDYAEAYSDVVLGRYIN